MRAPTWATPLSFQGLALDLTEFDLMADLDPYWIGWAAEAIVESAARAQAETAATGVQR
jgi:hypothetical protein